MNSSWAYASFSPDLEPGILSDARRRWKPLPAAVRRASRSRPVESRRPARIHCDVVARGLRGAGRWLRRRAPPEWFHRAEEASMQSAFSSPWESGHDRRGPSSDEQGSAVPPQSAPSLAVDDALLDRIHHLAQYKQRPVTLQQLLEIGRNPSREALLEEAQFLYQELPVRLSHRVVELEKLPFGLAAMPSVRTVHRMYVESLRDLISASRPEDEEGGGRY